MKKKIVTTALASILALSTLAPYAHADSPTVEKSIEQTNVSSINQATKFEDFWKNTPPVVDKGQEPTLMYSETIQYGENGNVIDRQVSGAEIKPADFQGTIINDGSFNWKSAGSGDADNRIEKHSYNVALILVAAFSNYLPTKILTSIAIGVSGSLAYFYQPPLVTYHTENYRDYDAVNEYVKSVTVTRNANGAKMYTDTKVQKFVR
ncbi:hypothetical protein COE80_22565 [Bacillus pseudomycoides]|uniref:hypothetical protein n=1 Tax=Bacillus TaxID=1386 RepID=UPI00036F366D|nr:MULTISPECIES: hypothetical protein [Bacillus]PHB21074.1 hypothetical protein COE80_22565 [Bacillus pseudomycoides]